MIDYEQEQLIPIKYVCRIFPGRTGEGISLASIWRWISEGRHGHKLETIIVGGERYTSREAVGRFIAAINNEDFSRQQAHGAHGDADRGEEKLTTDGLEP